MDNSLQFGCQLFGHVDAGLVELARSKLLSIFKGKSSGKLLRFLRLCKSVILAEICKTLRKKREDGDEVEGLCGGDPAVIASLNRND